MLPRKEVSSSTKWNRRPNHSRLCLATPLDRQMHFRAITRPPESIELWQLKGLDLGKKTRSCLFSTKHQAENSPRCGLALIGAVRKMTVLGKNEAWPKKGCFVTKDNTQPLFFSTTLNKVYLVKRKKPSSFKIGKSFKF